MDAVSSTLSLLATKAKEAPASQEFSIIQNETGTAVVPWEKKALFTRVARVFLRAIEDFLHLCFRWEVSLFRKSDERKALFQTVEWLQGTFGKNRLLRHLEKVGLSIEKMRRSGFLLTKEDLSELFVSLGIATHGDFEELFSEIKDETLSSVRGRSQEELHGVRVRLRNKTKLEECTTEELDILESFLLPFEKEDDQFWTPFEERNSFSGFRSISFSKMRESVSSARALLKRKELSREDWEVIFAKRFAQPALPEGLMLRHKDGYLQLKRRIEPSLVQASLFRSFDPQKLSSYVLFRGTCGGMPSDSWRSFLSSWGEDLAEELGGTGALHLLSELEPLLNEPKEGLIRDGHERLSFVGYSLGGVIASRIASLFPERVKRLTTVSAPGIEKKSCELFARAVERRDEKMFPGMQITHVVDHDDIVHEAGEAHLGAFTNDPRVKTSFRFLGKKRADGSEEPFPSPALSTDEAIRFNPIRSPNVYSTLYKMVKAHLRLTPVFPHEEKTFSTDVNREEVQGCLEHKAPYFHPSWEALRRKIHIGRSGQEFGSFLATWVPLPAGA